MELWRVPAVSPDLHSWGGEMDQGGSAVSVGDVVRVELGHPMAGCTGTVLRVGGDGVVVHLNDSAEAQAPALGLGEYSLDWLEFSRVLPSAAILPFRRQA